MLKQVCGDVVGLEPCSQVLPVEPLEAFFAQMEADGNIVVVVVCRVSLDCCSLIALRGVFVGFGWAFGFFRRLRIAFRGAFRKRGIQSVPLFVGSHEFEVRFDAAELQVVESEASIFLKLGIVGKAVFLAKAFVRDRARRAVVRPQL